MLVIGQLDEPGAVRVYDVDLVVAVRLGLERQALSVRRPRRVSVEGYVEREPRLPGAVGVHHVQLWLRGGQGEIRSGSVGEWCGSGAELRRKVGIPVGCEGDLGAVRRPYRPRVLLGREVGKARKASAVRSDTVDVGPPLLAAEEGDPFAGWIPGGVGILPLAVREVHALPADGIHHVDVHVAGFVGRERDTAAVGRPSWRAVPVRARIPTEADEHDHGEHSRSDGKDGDYPAHHDHAAIDTALGPAPHTPTPPQTCLPLAYHSTASRRIRRSAPVIPAPASSIPSRSRYVIALEEP